MTRTAAPLPTTNSEAPSSARPHVTTSARAGDRRVGLLGTLVILAVRVLGLSGAGTWALVQTSLAAENISAVDDAARFAGRFVYGPVGVPHTFSIVSPRARFLLGTEPAGFEGFVRAGAQPAGAASLPPVGTPAPDPARLAELAAEYGIDIIGPPGIPA